jgi:hypothetical protein
MRKLIPVEKLRNNLGKLENSPFVEFANEYLSGLPVENSGYLSWLKEQLKKYGKVWDYIKTEKDCVERAKKFKNLCLDIKNNGYVEQYKMHFNARKLAYGPLTVQKIKDGWYMIDGHHRASIQIALGAKELLCDEFVYSYQDMFPPAKKLKHVQFDWAGKSYLEIGCNIGAFGDLVLNKGAKNYSGFDHKEEYILEGRSRFPHLQLMNVKAQNIELQSVDVLVALGVFHHMDERYIMEVLKNIQSKWLLFENPLGTKQLPPYKVRSKEWYFEIIKPKSVKEFEYGFSYPIERKIFICER